MRQGATHVFPDGIGAARVYATQSHDAPCTHVTFDPMPNGWVTKICAVTRKIRSDAADG